MFRFKQFTVHHDRCAMKVGTDGVLLGTWTDLSGAETVLDIGSGTGLIALICAQRAPWAKEIVGVEYEQNAFEQSCENVADSPWNDRLKIVHQRIQDFAKEHEASFDCIVSNPPFFKAGNQAPVKERGQARHADDLTHDDLLGCASRLLKPNGNFNVILPTLEGWELIEEAKAWGLFASKVTEVKGRAHKPVERLLIRLEKTEKPLLKDELVVYAPEGYTPEFTALAKDFYLKL